jgi:hypothetical protein
LCEDIENTPIVRQRSSILDASRYIFVDAKQREDAAPFPRLPIPAGPGDCIEIKFTSSIEADSIFGTEKIAEMQAGTSVRRAIFKIVSIWDANREAPSFSGTTRSFTLFARCRTMKTGDTVVEPDTSGGDTIRSIRLFFCIGSEDRFPPRRSDRSILYREELIVTDTFNQLFASASCAAYIKLYSISDFAVFRSLYTVP